ncbi:unnamed protein product [Blepharisma stoltei]|uniref:lipid-A-disaccharide synthase n=1 Tax=Blepharisma stoltei TaxID=1481888 RepID=A0AAU9JNP7_9CILI|nr:unnamed protein product [Blepharisma stoltei]
MLKRYFSSGRVVCLLANSRKADRIGAQLMSDLKQVSGNSIKFIGSGGEGMIKEGITPLYNTDMFHPKPMVPFRTAWIEENNWWVWSKRNPMTKSYTKPMSEVLAYISKNQIIDKIAGFRPSVVLTLDHDQLSFRIHRQIAQLYGKTNLSRPKQVHYGNFVNKYQPYQLSYLDHVLYTMPLEPINWNKFKMPSTYIGQSAFEETCRFLLSRNGGDHLLTENSIFMNKDHFYSEMDQYIEAERNTFREKFGIAKDATVLFLAPGSLESEIAWSLPILNKTANAFIDEYAAPFSKRSDAIPVEKFVVVIPTTEKTKAYVSERVNIQGWKCRVQIVDTCENRKSAMAGSDLAICYNGDIVTECFVNQLSTIVIQNMKKMEFYCLLAWNRFTNDMNIIGDGNLFPEIIEGQCHPPKLMQILTQWHESPPHKFWPLQQMEMYLNKMLPIKKMDMGMGTHHEYFSPRLLAAKTVYEFAQLNPAREFPENENVFIKNLVGNQ